MLKKSLKGYKRTMDDFVYSSDKSFHTLPYFPQTLYYLRKTTV